MPELPPIRVKVDVDTSQLAESAVLLDRFGNRIKSNLGEADNALKSLGSSVEREGDKVVKAMDNTAKSTDVAKQKLIDFGAAGVQPMNALIGLGVALGIVLAPLLAYTAGLAGALALGGLVLGGMGILGAGVIALAEHYNNWAEASKNVTAAQKAVQTATEQNETAQEALDKATLAYNTRPTAMNLLNLKQAQEQAAESTKKMTDAQDALNKATVAADNPWTRLMTNLNQMALTLGQQATPAAGRLLEFFNSLIPKVEELGSRLITWFGGDRLSSALGIVVGLFDTFTKGLDRLGSTVGPVFDRLLANPKVFQDAFEKALGGVISFVGYLLQRLQDLSDWWAKNGPALEKTAQKSMDIIGAAVDGLFKALGFLILRLNDTELAVGTYSKSLTDKMAPASEDAKKRTENLNTVMGPSGLAGILGNAARAVQDFFQPLNTMAQNLATVIGWVLQLTDKLGAMHGWMGAVRDIIRDHVIPVFGDLARRGFEAAVPIIGVANAFNAIVGGIKDALYWWDRWTNRGGKGGGGGGGGGEGFTAQHGGVFPAGSWGRVGEVASELVYAMPGGGVMVTPESGSRQGSNITINVNGATLGELDEAKILSLFRRYVQLYS